MEGGASSICFLRTPTSNTKPRLVSARPQRGLAVAPACPRLVMALERRSGVPGKMKSASIAIATSDRWPGPSKKASSLC